MKSILKSFFNNKDGVVSLEFSLIAPALIFGSLYAMNLGYQVNKHQKLASSITAGSNFLQDYVSNNSTDTFRPNYNNENGQTSDSKPMVTAKHVIQSAYGDDLKLEDIDIETYCVCPNPNQSGEAGEEELPYDFTDPETKYYTKQKLTLWKKGELCSYNCPNDAGKARVVVEIAVDHNIHDLFAKNIIIREKLKTRFR